MFSFFGLNGLASPNGPFPIASDQVALELQNPTIAEPGFKNATGDGQSLWQSLSYAQLANAFDRGVALQADFGNINTDNPDLSAFKNRGGKMLAWHGLADELIMPQGTVMYDLLTNWVEKGTAPDQVTLQSSAGSVTISRPICVYPKKATYTSGDPTKAASYTCS